MIARALGRILPRCPLARFWLLMAICAAMQVATHAFAHDIYTNWMRPDFPRSSCCSNYDCAPTVGRYVDGHWQAKAPDGRWIDVPDAKILKFDSPDGLSHLCKSLRSDEVFCFMRPGVLG